MKTEVVYFSKTGHSKKLAEAVAEALSVEARDLSNQREKISTDLLFLVTGVYGGSPDPKVLDFIEALSPEDVKKVALITSSMGKKRQDVVRLALERKLIPVMADEYTCKGAFLLFGMGHPSADEIEGARAFALNTVKTEPLFS